MLAIASAGCDTPCRRWCRKQASCHPQRSEDFLRSFVRAEMRCEVRRKGVAVDECVEACETEVAFTLESRERDALPCLECSLSDLDGCKPKGGCANECYLAAVSDQAFTFARHEVCWPDALDDEPRACELGASRAGVSATVTSSIGPIGGGTFDYSGPATVTLLLPLQLFLPNVGIAEIDLRDLPSVDLDLGETVQLDLALSCLGLLGCFLARATLRDEAGALLLASWGYEPPMLEELSLSWVASDCATAQGDCGPWIAISLEAGGVRIEPGEITSVGPFLVANGQSRFYTDLLCTDTSNAQLSGVLIRR